MLTNNQKNHNLKTTVIAYFSNSEIDSINSGPSKYSAIIHHCFNTQNSTSRFSETCKPHKCKPCSKDFTNHLYHGEPRDPKSTEGGSRDLGISSLTLQMQPFPLFSVPSQHFFPCDLSWAGASIVLLRQVSLLLQDTGVGSTSLPTSAHTLFFGSQTTFPNTLVK